MTRDESNGRGPEGTPDYEASKRLARDGDPEARRRLAARTDVRPEVLYYLAVDESAAVREAVAANPAAPAQSSTLLARDRDESVRRVLAGKLARLLPDLSEDEQGRLFRLTVETIETLACDQALSVREAVATALKDVACAPPDLCRRLAGDVAREVAEPILHYCATLTDQDLLALIASQPQGWVLETIARRASVSGRVCDAIHASGNADATAALIANPGADMPEATLGRIVEESAERTSWQLPLARRPRLPGRMALRLAEFVDGHVLAILRDHPDLDPATAAEVAAVARRRLDFLETQPSAVPADQRVRRLLAEGRLDETAIGDALSWRDMEFVRLALAVRAGIRLAIVEAILASQSPKGVTALAWKAGLGMRFALQLQARGAGIPPRMLLNARNGTDYPLSVVEMEWQLEFHGAGHAPGP